MKKFKYKFKPWIVVLLSIGVIVAAAGIGINVYRLAANKHPDSYTLVSYIIALVISIAGGATFVSILVSSYYTVTDDELVLCWGFLKNRLAIKSIKRVVLNQSTDKLALYYNEDNFFVMDAKTVDPTVIADLLRKKNDRIIFEITSDDPPEKPV